MDCGEGPKFGGGRGSHELAEKSETLCRLFDARALMEMEAGSGLRGQSSHPC
jgi:hypothetical protein